MDSANPINYRTIIAEAQESHTNLGAHLEKALPSAWVKAYKRLSGPLHNIHRIHVGGFEFLFDLTDDLVQKGLAVAGSIAPDRLVAVHGHSNQSIAGRDRSRIQGFPRGAVLYTGASLRGRYDRGHFMAHSIGGGLDINLFPQLASINRGTSARGRIYRQMERYCESHPGTYCFSRPIYTTRTDHPFQIEYGILKEGQFLEVETFPNCPDEAEMKEIEEIFKNHRLIP